MINPASFGHISNLDWKKVEHNYFFKKFAKTTQLTVYSEGFKGLIGCRSWEANAIAQCKPLVYTQVLSKVGLRTTSKFFKTLL